MNEFIGNVVVHEKTNLFGRNVLEGNITIDEGVTLDNVNLYGDFHITQKNRVTSITDSVLIGGGLIVDCGIHNSYVHINGNSENFILNDFTDHKPRIFNDIMFNGNEESTELEKQNDIKDTIIEVE